MYGQVVIVCVCVVCGQIFLSITVKVAGRETTMDINKIRVNV